MPRLVYRCSCGGEIGVESCSVPDIECCCQTCKSCGACYVPAPDLILVKLGRDTALAPGTRASKSIAVHNSGEPHVPAPTMR